MDMPSSSQMEQLNPLKETNDYLRNEAATLLGDLTSELGLEARALHLPCMKKVHKLIKGSEAEMPTYESILQDKLTETEHRARELKQQWKKNGCSVILDSWEGQHDKSFISVLVHCSKGMLFLRSIDVSAIIDDVDELASMLSRVVDDVGANNIIQIITNDASSYMQAAESIVLKKHANSFFFTICADHCINLLLEKITSFDHVGEVLIKAREITRFIYKHELSMELKQRYIQQEIMCSCHLKFVAVFITLERLVSERANLVEMFISPEWVSYGWSSKSLFKRVSDIVKSDNEFWRSAADVLKVTKPLISVLHKLESDDCPMGILYDAMDVAKEEIKHNLGDGHGDYWDLIDKIWNNYLHNPIHAAGCILNPRIFYADQFSYYAEISKGIKDCITQLAQGHYNTGTVAAQMKEYESKSGSFHPDSANQQIMEKTQVDWWLEHGVGMPELHAFAIRILSQTCFGATRYNMDRRVSEECHRVSRTYTQRQRQQELEYVHYNLHFSEAVPNIDGPDELDTTQLGEWVMYPANKATTSGSDGASTQHDVSIQSKML